MYRKLSFATYGRGGGGLLRVTRFDFRWRHGSGRRARSYTRRVFVDGDDDDPSSFQVSRRMSHHVVRATVVIAALSLAVFGPPVQAQDKPSTAQELADLRASAKAGDTDTQVLLGAMYYIGDGVPQVFAEAVAWFREAAAQSHTEAQYFLGMMYAKGEGVPQDDALASAWFHKAAEQGHADAQLTIGLRCATGEGVPQDDAEAIDWFRKAAEQGDAEAQHNIGVGYSKGRGVPQDDVEAAAWYRRAAEQGLADAQFTLGTTYRRGEGVPQDDAEAASWYREAAAQGHTIAQLTIGLMYFTGRGVPQDDAEAIDWLRKAAEQGQADAQLTIGDMYRDGRGVPQDDVEAVAWYRRAAEQGHTDAQARMEQMRAAQQQVTPTPASDAASLFQAQSVRCEWGRGTIVSWDEGRPSLEQGNFGKDAGIVFDSIDTQAGTARIIGNAAAGDIRVVETPVGLTFIEQATFGGLNFTTVFAHFVGPGNVALAAVTSRHLSFVSPFPSQYHGTCVILQ